MQRAGHNAVPRLYRDADDGAQSLPHAVYAHRGTSGKKLLLAIDACGGLVMMPWQMTLVGKIMGILPNRLYDTLAAKSGPKTRKNECRVASHAKIVFNC